MAAIASSLKDSPTLSALALGLQSFEDAASPFWGGLIGMRRP
jgi:hypothetical protein